MKKTRRSLPPFVPPSTVVVGLLLSTSASAALPPDAPGWVHAEEVAIVPGESVEAFLARAPEALSLSEDSELVAAPEVASLYGGLSIVRVRHLYQGVAVVDDSLILRVDDGVVRSALARVVPNLAASLSRLAPQEEAESTATHAFVELGLVVPSPICTTQLARPPGHPDELPSAVWSCVAYDATGVFAGEVVLDAYSLETRLMHDGHAHWTPTTAVGPTVYDSVQSFSAESQATSSPAQWRMSGPNVRTLTINYTGDASLWYPFADTDITTSNAPTFPMSAAPEASLHWGGEQALAMQNAWLGIDTRAAMTARLGQPQFINLMVRGQDIAEQARNVLRFGESNGHPIGTLDVVGHEYGHAAVGYQQTVAAADTSYLYSEWGSMEESLADILGSMTEFRTRTTTDWILGGDLPASVGFSRHMIDPALSVPPQPDVYGGQYFVPSPLLPDGWPHPNSSIYSLWFTRMALGATGTNSAMVAYDVEGIGAVPAQKIAFGTYIEELPTLGTYYAATKASQVFIRDHCGDFSREARASHNAWHSVGLQTAPVTGNEFLVPADQATAVSPWPTKLKWQAAINGPAETTWEIEISTDANFASAATHSYVSTQSEVDGGIGVGIMETDLEPDTTYYWRVRKTPFAADFECWRPTRSFTTSDAAPTPFYPSGGTIHPWAIPFAWSQVEGATFYEVEVSDGEKVLFENRQVFAADPEEPDPSEAITVPKLAELVWRVRAIRQPPPPAQGEVFGAWSSPVSFMTDEPQAMLVSPPNGSYQYPWPLEFVWQPLRGATFDLSAVGVGPKKSRMTPIRNLETKDTFALVSVNAEAEPADNTGLEWEIATLGPPLGSESLPDDETTRESGKISSAWTVYIDGRNTEVQSATAPLGCLPYNSTFTFSWAPVDGASTYSVSAYGPATVTEGTSATFAAKAPQGYGGFLISMDAETTENLGPGFLRASNFGSTFERYEVAPTKPIITAIYPDAFEPEEMDYDWYSEFANSDYWDVELYEGTTCSGSLVAGGTHRYPPDVEEGHNFGARWNNVQPGAHSMRIRNAANGLCAPSPWSDCVAFDGPRPPEPAPPPNAATCGQQVVNGGNLGAYFAVQLPSTGTGQVQLQYDHICVPDRTIVRDPYGIILHDTGCVATRTPASLPEGCEGPAVFVDAGWAPFLTSSYVTVQVIPDCMLANNTEWAVKVDCQMDP